MNRRGYPVNLGKDGKHIAASFPDIPEAHNCGNNRGHALKMAKEALETATELYFDDQRPAPVPSRPWRGQLVVELASGVAAMVLLLRRRRGRWNWRGASAPRGRK